MVQETDVLLVGGGDALYLCYWMRQSGLADLFPSLRRETVYVGVSAGSMVVTSHIGETYVRHKPPSGDDIKSEAIVLATPHGELKLTFAIASGMGLVDFSLFPHLDHENMPDNSLANAERWAAQATGADVRD